MTQDYLWLHVALDFVTFHSIYPFEPNLFSYHLHSQLSLYYKHFLHLQYLKHVCRALIALAKSPTKLSMCLIISINISIASTTRFSIVSFVSTELSTIALRQLALSILLKIFDNKICFNCDSCLIDEVLSHKLEANP